MRWSGVATKDTRQLVEVLKNLREEKGAMIWETEEGAVCIIS